MNMRRISLTIIALGAIGAFSVSYANSDSHQMCHQRCALLQTQADALNNMNTAALDTVNNPMVARLHKAHFECTAKCDDLKKMREN